MVSINSYEVDDLIKFMENVLQSRESSLVSLTNKNTIEVKISSKSLLDFIQENSIK